MGRTPPPDFRSAVSFESASAAAALGGKFAEATLCRTSWRAFRAAGAPSTTRQCSQRPPPTAAPLPLGVLRSARFVSFVAQSAGAA